MSAPLTSRWQLEYRDVLRCLCPLTCGYSTRCLGPAGYASDSSAGLLRCPESLRRWHLRAVTLARSGLRQRSARQEPAEDQDDPEPERRMRRIQPGEVHTAWATTRPTPTAIAHTPSHRSSNRHDRAAQSAAMAKLPRATHALAKARLPVSDANRSSFGSSPSLTRNAASCQAPSRMPQPRPRPTQGRPWAATHVGCPRSIEEPGDDIPGRQVWTEQA